ncbi:MAG: protein-glutamate O-methyltransferase CheR [Archangiaceae bacterium]|nr:protein-glutamate O-methyltransferase CheR [Archangiaceae bacterium]
MTAEQFRLLSDLVHGASGLAMREDFKFVAERRLLPRVEALGLSDFGAYQRYLRFDARGREELELACELLLPHETYFFREPNQLECFVNEIVPRLVEQHRGRRRLRLWSAGCSTGEEPYTLAMLLEETGRFEGWDVQVHGTDLSRRVLSTARKAEYAPSALRSTSPERKLRHFEVVPGGKVRVKAPLRAQVSFSHLNLIVPEAADLLPFMDVVFCRNVLIYFDLEARRRVISSLYRRMQPGAWLLLGHSESLLTVTTDFEIVQLDGDLVYRVGQS